MTIELASKIQGTVLVPGDEGYAAGIHRWAANAERNAAVVVQVTSPADVSATVSPQFPFEYFLIHMTDSVCQKSGFGDCD